MPQLFEMFFQANPSLDRTAGGLGIGLSVAKRMVELRGGSIESYSERNWQRQRIQSSIADYARGQSSERSGESTGGE